MGITHSKRTHDTNPPLPWYDYLLYALFFFGSIAISLWIFQSHSTWRADIAFSDPTVLASSPTASYFFLLPGVFPFLILSVLSAALCLSRYPLIGRFDREYFKVLPLLRSHTKTHPSCDSAVKERTSFRRLILGILLCCLLLPLSLSGRVCLHEDGSISGYNAFNQQVFHHEKEEVYMLTVEACKIAKAKYSAYPSVRVEFYIKGYGLDPFEFSLKDFLSVCESSPDSRLTAMQIFKNQFPEEIIRYKNSVSAEDIAVYYHFDSQERKILDELLGE